MPFETTAAERVIHLFLFIAAAGLLGVCALAVVERLAADAGMRSVKLRWMAVSGGVVAGLFLIERLYHALA